MVDTSLSVVVVMNACVGRWGKCKGGIVVIASGNDDPVLKVILREELKPTDDWLEMKVEIEYSEEFLWSAVCHVSRNRDDAGAGWQFEDCVFWAFSDVDDAVAFVKDPGNAAQATIVTAKAILAGHQQLQLREQ